ncbi:MULTISPECIES: AraC family transcriptional regulator [unclassified Cedecea]|uniref:AraC family transcriptional regulator n=1 Tax=unclassified Cedecea TaxID=2649846 RepID=UPI00301B202C
MDIKAWLSQQSNAATSVFHMGRYCGPWKASTHATGNSSFHVVLEGECWLALEEGRERTKLHEGDIAFFFTNRPFYLVSSADAPINELPLSTMKPLNQAQPEDTALLCGFIQPVRHESKLLFALMPEFLLIKRDGKISQRLHTLFELLKIECWQAENECELTISRLTDLLLAYVVEEILDEHLVDINILKASQCERLTSLMLKITHHPSEKWSIECMAASMHMSRSTFIRRIQETCSYSPNELVMRLRINIAVNLLRRGISMTEASQQVGYDSLTGFYKAFRKVTMQTPTQLLKNLTH